MSLERKFLQEQLSTQEFSEYPLMEDVPVYDSPRSCVGFYTDITGRRFAVNSLKIIDDPLLGVTAEQTNDILRTKFELDRQIEPSDVIVGIAPGVISPEKGTVIVGPIMTDPAKVSFRSGIPYLYITAFYETQIMQTLLSGNPISPTEIVQDGRGTIRKRIFIPRSEELLKDLLKYYRLELPKVSYNLVFTGIDVMDKVLLNQLYLSDITKYDYDKSQLIQEIGSPEGMKQKHKGNREWGLGVLRKYLEQRISDSIDKERYQELLSVVETWWGDGFEELIFSPESSYYQDFQIQVLDGHVIETDGDNSLRNTYRDENGDIRKKDRMHIPQLYIQAKMADAMMPIIEFQAALLHRLKIKNANGIDAVLEDSVFGPYIRYCKGPKAYISKEFSKDPARYISDNFITYMRRMLQDYYLTLSNAYTSPANTPFEQELHDQHISRLHYYHCADKAMIKAVNCVADIKDYELAETFIEIASYFIDSIPRSIRYYIALTRPWDYRRLHSA